MRLGYDGNVDIPLVEELGEFDDFALERASVPISYVDVFTVDIW